MAVSEQTRINRRIAGRKAALARKMRRGGYQAGGPMQGSAPVDWDFRAVLERVKLAAQRQAQDGRGAPTPRPLPRSGLEGG